MEGSPLDLLAGTGFARTSGFVEALEEPALRYVPPVPVIRRQPCKYCGALTLYAIEDRGNAMTVDPDLSGPYVVDGVSALDRPLVRLVGSTGDVLRCGTTPLRRIRRNETRYASHYAFCEGAEAWTRSRFVTDPWARAAIEEARNKLW